METGFHCCVRNYCKHNSLIKRNDSLTSGRQKFKIDPRFLHQQLYKMRFGGDLVEYFFYVEAMWTLWPYSGQYHTIFSKDGRINMSHPAHSSAMCSCNISIKDGESISPLLRTFMGLATSLNVKRQKWHCAGTRSSSAKCSFGGKIIPIREWLVYSLKFFNTLIFLSEKFHSHYLSW